MEISWNFVSLEKWEPWLWFSTCTEIFNTLFQHISNMKIWNIYSQIVTEPTEKYV